MHYCCLLFTDKIPSKKDISDKLAPFNEEAYYSRVDEGEEGKERPVFLWDWYEIGGRYKGEIKLKLDWNDDKYRWKYLQLDNYRNGRLFISELCSRLQEIPELLGKLEKATGKFQHIYYDETEWLLSMGANDGYIYVDGAEVQDIINYDDLNCWCYVDSNGVGNARDYWNGDKYITNENFDEELNEVKNRNKGKFVTVLDIHD